MILIFSQKDDFTTNRVIDWLLYLNKPYIRINRGERFSIKSIEGDIILVSELHKIKIYKVTSIWYRRGALEIKHPNIKQPELQAHLQTEYAKIKQYINYLFTKKKRINNMHADVSINRIIVSEYASKAGLLVPKFYLISEPNELKKVLKKENLITKTIMGSTSFVDKTNNKRVIVYTNNVETKAIKKIDNISYFEESIDKKYELRVFYLDGKFWSMAIFSQKNDSTSQDFRRYDKEKPNRTVPYSLPKTTEKKLDSLMKKLKLKSGSIDMIVTPEDEIYFLEINPMGQFSMVSFPCNYNLEKEIATYL